MGAGFDVVPRMPDRSGQSAFAFIAGRLRNRPDGEHNQAINRTVIVLLVVCYFYFFLYFYNLEGGHLFFYRADDDAIAAAAGLRTALVVAVWYLALSLANVAAIIAWPQKSVVRRVVAMVADILAVSALMHLAGMLGTPLYLLYIWITFGYGFRYGVRYMAASAGMSLAGFLVVIVTTDYWMSQPTVALGLVAVLIFLPAYAVLRPYALRLLTRARGR